MRILVFSLCILGLVNCNYMLTVSSHCIEGLQYDEALQKCVEVIDIGVIDQGADSEIDIGNDLPDGCQPDSSICSGLYDYLVCTQSESGTASWQYGGSCGIDSFGSQNLCYHESGTVMKAICCNNNCEEGSSECDGEHEYHDCEVDENGCIQWGESKSCSKDSYNQWRACNDGTEEGIPTTTCCPNECKSGRPFCKTDLTGYYANCMADGNNCYKGTGLTSCPSGFSCKASLSKCVTPDTLISSSEKVTNIGARIKVVNNALYVISWFDGDASIPFTYPNSLINASANVGFFQDLFHDFFLTSGIPVIFDMRWDDRHLKINRLDSNTVLQTRNFGKIEGWIYNSDGTLKASMDYVPIQFTNFDISAYRVVPFDDRFVIIWLETKWEISHNYLRGTARYSNTGYTVAASDFDPIGHSVAANQIINTERLNDTSFVLVWHGSSYPSSHTIGLNGTLYSSDGKRLHTFQVTASSVSNYDPLNQRIFRVDDHRFIISWNPPYMGEFVSPQLSFFNSQGSKIRADLPVGFSSSAPYASLGEGPTFRLFCPFFTGNPNPFQINGAIIDGEGAIIASDFNIQINSYTIAMEGDQIQIAAIAEKAFVIVWPQIEIGASDYDIFAVKIDSEGKILSSVFRVNQNTTGTQYYPAVDVWGNNIIILWEHQPQNTSSNVAIYGQMIYFP